MKHQPLRQTKTLQLAERLQDYRFALNFQLAKRLAMEKQICILDCCITSSWQIDASSYGNIDRNVRLPLTTDGCQSYSDASRTQDNRIRNAQKNLP